MRRHLASALSIALAVAVILFWNWSLDQSFPAIVDVLCIVGGPLAVIPVVRIGRALLDRHPSEERARTVTVGVHSVVMLLLGVAIVRGLVTARAWRGVRLPVPSEVGMVLVWITSAVVAFTVINLAVTGHGAPSAVSPTRRLTHDWLYARTRNPMVVATLACLFAAGLMLQSALFLIWVALLLTPVWIAFLKVYEERELEVRFGDDYRAYRAATPFLWPRPRVRT